ncbi:MAG: DUF4381 domain-containing protein [Aeromonas sp.]|uniref:DUF4381 domain-containing protein n=1 Tax=Aeromonas sp. TaxID=647 RepID=UPI002FC7623C
MTAKVPAIDQLKELAIPTPPVSYLPQTWGWGVLLLVVLLLLLFWGGRRWWQWRRDRYRREALARLDMLQDALGEDGARLTALRELPVLLKRVALSMPGGAAAAWLGGEAWQGFLAKSAPFSLPADFADDLFTLAYAPSDQILSLPGNRVDGLFNFSRRWIGEHHVAV